jgi:hypothetical protein
MEVVNALALLSSTQTNRPERTLLLAVALISFSALLLELALTRLFSVVLFYHFAFLAISIALLGLGAGGVFAHLSKQFLAKFETRWLAASGCMLAAMLVLLALEIIVHVPVSLELSWNNFGKLTAMYFAAALPFFSTGLIFSVIFARMSYLIPKLYSADLTGGATACLAFVPLLNWIGAPNTVLFAGLALLLAAAICSPGAPVRKTTLLSAAAMALILAANYSGQLIDVIYAKGQRHDRSTGLEYVRWNAVSRVEVNGYPNGAKNIVIDADAGTAIMNVDPHGWRGTPWERNLMGTAPALVNLLRPRGEFAIIGPGGGVDVLRAVGNGSPSVTAIEINPIIANHIMRGRYADYAHHLYEIPEVHMKVSDGRSFIRNAHAHYDVVQMTLVDTWASTAAGAFALSENNLYTVEAFAEYFEHLRPDGLIAITRWEFKQPREALRVVAVAMESLHRLGIINPARHFLVVSEGDLDEDGIPVVVLAKKSPFSAEEERAVQAELDRYPVLVPLYMPSHPGDNAFSALMASNNPYAFARGYAYNVAPVTDNAPFFFFTLKTGQILNEDFESGIDWKVNLGVVVLGMVLIISVVAVLAFLIVPLLLRSQGQRQSLLPVLFFVAIGLGYIMVEIAFIQRFVLFLGHPTYALTVVIFLLLLSSGAGSLVSRRWLSHTERIWLPLTLIIAALLLYAFALPGILSALVGVTFVVKLIVSGVFLVPLGVAMGTPFPTGLRTLARSPAAEFPAREWFEANQPERSRKGSVVEWAWAMNAASSVLGSVVAMVMAIHLGLDLTLACGAAAYLLALTLSRTLEHTHA